MAKHQPWEFNQREFNKHDKKAREAVKKYYRSRGFEIWDNPDIYGIDLLTHIGGIEVQVVNGWKDGIYPYPIMQAACRKQKYFGFHNVFVWLNKWHTKMGRAYSIDWSNMTWHSTYGSKEENFWEWPLRKVNWVDL